VFKSHKGQEISLLHHNAYSLDWLWGPTLSLIQQLFLIFVFFYVLFVLCHSMYCLCVYVYCTTATGWLSNCS